MVAYGYLLVELNFGAAFLCNLNHFIHALARFFLCIGVVCVNIIHLRAKRSTVRNYQNLLGFHWENPLFDVIFSCRRDTDNAVFLTDFCKQLIPGICILCQHLFNTFQLHIAGCQRIIDRVRLIIGSFEAAGGLF